MYTYAPLYSHPPYAVTVLVLSTGVFDIYAAIAELNVPETEYTAALVVASATHAPAGNWLVAG